MSKMGRWRFVALAGAVALVITACGSSKSTSTPTTPTTAPAGTSATTAPTSATSAVSGTPYKLMLSESSSDGSDNYVGAIEKGINARGGIAGHPLQIVVCNDNNSASQATMCAQKAVADPSMLGLIGNSSTCSSQLLPILATAKMASINDSFFCPEDFKSPQSFPFTGGTLADTSGSALGVKYFKNPNVVVTTVDLPAGHEYPPLVSGIVAPVGGKVVASVYVPYTAADMAPFAAQIAAHPGVLAYGVTVAVGIRLGKALESQGYNQPIIYNSTTFDPSIIKANFGNPTNAYISEYYNQSSAGWSTFESDMNTYAPGVTYRAGDLVGYWLAANVVAEIAKTLPTVSAQSIFSYMSTATALGTFGMTQPLNFTVPQKGFGGLIPRAANPDVSLYHYVNGSLVQVTPFEDLLP